jgi:3-hydroxyacyl-CoA dehydrogenase/enoyl-CoA hydratase/3-hydroxybutyryl-CoA epimerase
MILTGKEVVARQALSRGLADLLAPAGLLDEAARRFARELAGDHAAPERVRERRRRRVAWTQRLLSGPLSGITFALAQRSIGRAGRFYPAPLEILALVRRTLKLPRAEALQLEAEAFGRLAATPVSKNLVRVFFVTEALKKAPAPAPAPGRIAVLGAGVMGAGLAAVALERGMSVRLRDVETRFLAAGAKRIHEHLAGRVRRRRMEPREMEQALARLGPTTELTGFGSLELVLEAAIEDLAVKQRIFREVEERVPDTTVLATNTSSLRVSDLARALRAPERFVGIHFFNPPDRMPLVELVRGEATSAETLARALAFARALGKYPVIVQDRPGFLVNRVLFPYLGEAVLLVEQGNGIRDVDRAALDFGMPMGPLRVLDEVGLDVAVRAARSLEAAYPGRAGGSGLLSRMVERGWLGRKSGRGFYVYRGRRVSPNSGVPALGTRGAPVPDAQDRLVRALRDEAARALSEGVVGTVEELDAALILGAGFPPFRGGVSLLPDFRAG